MPLFKALVCQQSPSSAAMMTFYDVDKRSSRYLQEDKGKRMHAESNVKVACINVQARAKCKMRWGGGEVLLQSCTRLSFYSIRNL